jgi:hypothetical protein
MLHVRDLVQHLLERIDRVSFPVRQSHFGMETQGLGAQRIIVEVACLARMASITPN